MKIAIQELKEDEIIPYNLLLEADESVESIDRYIHRCTILMAYNEDKLVGVCALYKHAQEPLEIKNVAVSESFRGKGIGSLLIRAAESEAIKCGAKQLLIATADVAEAQLRLYRRLGYVNYSVRKNFFIDNFPEPLIEDGKQLRDMLVLKKELVG